jgi:hypothetical protein
MQPLQYFIFFLVIVMNEKHKLTYYKRMKRIPFIFIAIVALSVLFMQHAIAQPCGRSFIPNFIKGKTDLSFGLGFGTHVNYPGTYTTVPLFSVNVDHALRDDIGPGVIGVGGYLGYERFRDEYIGGEYGFNYSSVVFQARGTYHYQFIENFDSYAGLGLGLRYVNSSAFGIHPVNDGIEPRDGLHPVASIFIGGRYFFTETVAAFAEAGIGVSYLTLGVTFRLRDF